MYLAIINMPGYLPETEPVEFESCADAWRYLLEELERDWDAAEENGDFEGDYLEAHCWIHSHDLNQPGSVQVEKYVYSVDIAE